MSELRDAIRTAPDHDALDMRRRAVSLVDRLVAVDARAIAAEAELTRLRDRLAGQPASHGAGAAWFTPEVDQHPWPLADNPDADTAALTYYERRVDDVAILAGHAGAAFQRQYELDGAAPRLASAAVALLAGECALRAPKPGDAPDVSIVIPIYGQLGWTLNCLHALLAHHARPTVEVILADDASPDATGPALAGLAEGLPVLRHRRQPRNLGFIANCNDAAAASRGAMLVLLNNDTRVVPGWLDALLDSFARFPRAGLVGSKLLYPDGRLQEAGGIIWRDGSAWNYGRDDDPNRPRYAHARQADYISGASVAIPAALWRSLGGFDTRFAPAYSEDADLAMRLRAAGHEVWFQPQSRVIHYEGKTSGTDTAHGVKAHQVVNERKLFLRWRETLATHRRNGDQPYLERDRGAVKRALIVDATNPTPKQDAGSVTTTLTLRLFQELGYKMYFVPQDNFLFEPEHTEALLGMGVECGYAPYDVGFAQYIQRHGMLFDVVLVYRVTVLDRVLADLRRHAPQATVLFHNMDLHYLRMQRAAEMKGSAEAMADAMAMKEREVGLMRQVDCTITHSTYEQALIAAEAPDTPVVVWPFMFDFFGTQAGFASRRDFCFLGGYRHGPNVDAVMFFARDVLPIIRRKLPGARFIIAGANPGPDVLALQSPDIVVTGQIEDLRDVFDRVRVFACSLRIGAGTKGKVSTAMSYGLPVVSTTCGAEGMDLIDGEDVLIADTAEDFAAACLRLHEDAALWARLSLAGQDLVREKHSLGMGRRVLADAIEIALAHRLGIGPRPLPARAAGP